ncbi:Alpha/Beta hydrolase protein [Xylariomycetidae sp. FL2044]|nr:Alpha/Beta hydrolase protein [Xylariomycetidae sp. FL2044]
MLFSPARSRRSTRWATYALASLTSTASFQSVAHAAALTRVADFGANPTNLEMYIYVPDTLAESPPVIIVPHPCGGSAQDTYGRVTANLPSYADALGFVLVFPTTPNGCWDHTSAASLTHDGGGDTQGLASMAAYALGAHGGENPGRVYAAGSSSGGMITNALLAAYPDVFAAGASFSGAPAGCWDGNNNNGGNNSPNCPGAGQSFTAEQWAAVARGAYPGYDGARPRVQVWHGTADAVVVYRNLEDQLLQWGGVLGVGFAGNVTDTPEVGYTKMVYGDDDGARLVGYSAQGVGHMVPFHDQEVLKFFGIM